MNGEGRELLTDVSLGWPSGITLDTASKRVFWIDAKLDHMEVLQNTKNTKDEQVVNSIIIFLKVMNYDGTRRSVFVTDLPHPFSLSILGSYLFWTDWQRRSVERVDKNTGLNRATVLDQLPDIMGVKGRFDNVSKNTFFP